MTQMEKFRLLSLVMAFVLLLTVPASAATTVTVQRGESLWILANRYGTTMQAIRSANGLSGSEIRAGQRLVIPDGGQSGPGGGSSGASRVTVTVRRGDSLWLLATRYGTTMQAIRAANGLRGSEIRTGQRLIIPVGQSAGGSAAPAGSGPASSGTAGARIAYTEADVDLLSRLVAAEACRQPYAGRVAVASVVINRVLDPRFPNTIREVVYARNQFQPVQNGYIWQVERYCSLDNTRQAVLDALRGWDPTGGALYFYNPAKVGYHSFLSNRPVAVTIGDHRFTY